MLSSNNQRNVKINRDVSNFIITQVLERSDDLIKNSYRRLTTENVARNEHWAKIAEKVSEKFEIPAEMERVKSHFHNRKKVLLARIKDELRLVNNSALMTTEEKIEELIGRRVLVGEYDEQLARVCLDIEEEEKGRNEQFAGEPGLMFAETKHESLLTQLLNSTVPSIPLHQRRESSAAGSPMASGSSRDSDTVAAPLASPKITASSRAPLLCKLLTDPSTSSESLERMRLKPPPLPTVGYPDRKRPAAIPPDHFQFQQSSVLQSPNPAYLSHLIVDVTSPQELKRLLGILIDNGFSRFQHVGSLDAARTEPAPEIIRRSSKIELAPVVVERQSQELMTEDHSEKSTMESGGAAYFREEDWYRAALPTEGMDVVKEIQKRVEHVEVKVEPIDFEMDDEGEEEEVDEHTAELEAQLSSEAIKNGLALFEKPPSPKKQRIVKGEIVEDVCKLCGTMLRLNAGGSKWNFYEHVIMKHSGHKPFKCPLCPYQTGRKVRVRNHCIYQHNQEADPIDITTPEVRREWLETMSKCFPDHQYGKSGLNIR